MCKLFKCKYIYKEFRDKNCDAKKSERRNRKNQNGTSFN